MVNAFHNYHLHTMKGNKIKHINYSCNIITLKSVILPVTIFKFDFCKNSILKNIMNCDQTAVVLPNPIILYLENTLQQSRQPNEAFLLFKQSSINKKSEFLKEKSDFRSMLQKEQLLKIRSTWQLCNFRTKLDIVKLFLAFF